MAAKKCNSDRLAQRVTVFVTDFIRNTYGFLKPDHVDQLRAFRNEVEDNYPACGVIPNPWQTEEDAKLSASNASESEEDDIIPAKKRTRVLLSDNSDPFTTPSKKRSESEWTASNEEEASDSDQSYTRDFGARRVQIPIALYFEIKEMFYPFGPRQLLIEEKKGKKAFIRRALDWEGNVITNLLVTDSGRFFIKYDERGPGVVVEFLPTINNRSVNIHGGKLPCAALIYRTFTRDEPSLPLIQCQFKAKDGNPLNLSVENLIFTPLATATTRKPRNNYQKYTLSVK